MRIAASSLGSLDNLSADEDVALLLLRADPGLAWPPAPSTSGLGMTLGEDHPGAMDLAFRAVWLPFFVRLCLPFGISALGLQATPSSLSHSFQ